MKLSLGTHSKKNCMVNIISNDDDSDANASKVSSSVDAFPIIEEEDIVEMTLPDHKVGLPCGKQHTPLTIMVADTIGALCSRTLMKVLLDPGSTTSFISRKCLPRNCKPVPIKTTWSINTLAGNGIAQEMVEICGIRLPELDKNCVVQQHKALIFDTECKYDLILGADFLDKSCIDILYSTGMVQ